MVTMALALSGQAWAGDSASSCGCCAAAPDANPNDGKIKHCARRLCAWLTYQPNRCLACKGLITPVNYPPLYTFFPCNANTELPPYTWCKSDCERKEKFKFGKRSCADCAEAPTDAKFPVADTTAPQALPAVQQATLVPAAANQRQ